MRRRSRRGCSISSQFDRRSSGRAEPISAQRNESPPVAATLAGRFARPIFTKTQLSRLRESCVSVNQGGGMMFTPRAVRATKGLRRVVERRRGSVEESATSTKIGRYYSRPDSLKENVPRPSGSAFTSPTITWSSRSISRILAASRSLRVTCMSAALGAGSPLG